MSNFKKMRKDDFDFINIDLVFNCWMVKRSDGWVVRVSTVGERDSATSDIFESEEAAIEFLDYLMGKGE